jgi:hypothetical protein
MAEMQPKPKKKTRKRTYQKPVSLYPLKFEDAVKILLKAKKPKN